MNRLKESFLRNKTWLLFSLISTFLWGFLAHGYCFFDNSVSHDSLNEYHAAIFGNEWKMQLGRIFTPFYRDLLRSDATLPWLIGVLSLFWLGLTVFLILRIFRVGSKVTAFLIAGVFTVNISVSAIAATYLNDLDSNMFALLCAIAAVYLWKRSAWGVLPGGVLIAVSLGIYQSYLFAAIAVVMFVCIFWILDGETFPSVMLRGLRAIGMFLLGGLLYYLAMKAVLSCSGLSLTSGDYNSLDKALELTPLTFFSLAAGAYQDFFFRLMNAYTTYPSIIIKGITLLLLGLSAISIAVGLLQRHIRIPEKLLCLLLICLLPFAMNLLYVLTIGENHDLMVYAIWLFYLLALLLADWLLCHWKNSEFHAKRKQKAAAAMNLLCMLAVFVILYGSVQFSNGMYLKKDQEYDAYLSLMTRIVGRMEGCEAYIPGETPVVFVGLPTDLNKITPGFKEYRNVIGMLSSDVICLPEKSRYQAYFDYVLGTPILLAEDSVWKAVLESPSTAEMPDYPASGCLEMLDGVLIVKLGDVPK